MRGCPYSLHYWKPWPKGLGPRSNRVEEVKYILDDVECEHVEVTTKPEILNMPAKIVVNLVRYFVCLDLVATQ